MSGPDSVPASLSPAKVPAWSALSFRGRTICYELRPTESDNTFFVSARELGRSEVLEVTDELRAAILADLARQAAKAQQP